MGFDIPIELFITFLGATFGLALLGLIRQPQIPAMIAFAGMFMLAFSVATDNIIISYGDQSNITYVNSTTTNTVNNYEVETTTGSVNLNQLSTIAVGEMVTNTASELYHDHINCIDMYLSRSGSLTGNVTVGIFDGNSTMKRQFGTINVSSINSNNAFYNTCVTSGGDYSIVNSDVIGVKYPLTNGTGNYAVKFDGINGVVNATSNTKLRIGEVQGSSGAYVFYFREGATPSTNEVLFSKGVVDAFINTSGNLLIDVKYQNIADTLSQTIKTGVADNRWHQVIVQFSNVTGTTQAYYDNSLVYSASKSDYIQSSSGIRLLIGSAPSGTSQALPSKASIDKFAVYSNKTFDQTEVTNLFNGNSITTGLTAMYEFNEGTGTTAGDSSGNGITATLYGGTTWVASRAGDLIRVAVDASGPFDGTNTVEASYATSWITSSNTDVTMRMSLISNNTSLVPVAITTQQPNSFQFTELPKTLFGVFSAILILAGALMVYRE